MQQAHRSHLLEKVSTDLVLVAASYFAAVFVAKRHMGLFPPLFRLYSEEWLLLGFLAMTWLVFGRLFGLYDEFRSRSLSSELLALLKTVLLVTAFGILFLFLYKDTVLSRFFVGWNMILQVVLTATGKIFWRLQLGRMHRRGKKLRFILLVGGGRMARDFERSVDLLPHLGYRVIGFLGESEGVDWGERFRGDVGNLEAVLAEAKIDDVVVVSPRALGDRMGEVISACERYPVSLRLIPDFFDTVGPRFSISMFAHYPILSLRTIPLENVVPRFFKRAFDIALSLFLFLVLFSWLWPIIALAIKISSPGPIFFTQERWGRKNRRITCYKFRSMVQESRDQDDKGRYLQASRNDPRVTRVGQWLRRTNLDELPQFINVLRGEMSVVGPRPHPTPLNLESKDRIERYLLRHLVKPGITGWAQVNGYRGETQDPEMMKERVEHDIWYIENWTFPLDLQIVAITLWRMVRGDPSAY